MKMAKKDNEERIDKLCKLEAEAHKEYADIKKSIDERHFAYRRMINYQAELVHLGYYAKQTIPCLWVRSEKNELSKKNNE